MQLPEAFALTPALSPRRGGTIWLHWQKSVASGGTWLRVASAVARSFPLCSELRRDELARRVGAASEWEGKGIVIVRLLWEKASRKDFCPVYVRQLRNSHFLITFASAGSVGTGGLLDWKPFCLSEIERD
jgi:hypothetical protein